MPDICTNWYQTTAITQQERFTADCWSLYNVWSSSKHDAGRPIV